MTSTRKEQANPYPDLKVMTREGGRERLAQGRAGCVNPHATPIV